MGINGGDPEEKWAVFWPIPNELLHGRGHIGCLTFENARPVCLLLGTEMPFSDGCGEVACLFQVAG